MVIVGLIFLAVVAAVAFQNPTEVTVKIFVWSYPTSLGLGLIAAAVVGAVIIYLSGLFAQRDLRAQLRVAESRLRELERQRPEPHGPGQRQATGNETPQPPRA